MDGTPGVNESLPAAQEETLTEAMDKTVNGQAAQDPSIPFSEDFQNRMATVFGGLGGSSEGSSWSLKASPVFKPGKDVPAAEADDLDDDDVMEVAKSSRRPLMSGDVWAADEDEAQGIMCDPDVSHQFRQAFEDEQEADEYDQVAATSFEEGAADTIKLQRHMEVADDNVFDRLCGHTRHGPLAAAMDAPTPMEVELEPPAPRAAPTPPTPTLTPPVSQQATKNPPESAQQNNRPKEKRRVRFALDAAPKSQKASEDAHPGNSTRSWTADDSAGRSTGEHDRDDEGGGTQLPGHANGAATSGTHSQRRQPHHQNGHRWNRGSGNDQGDGRRWVRRGGRHVPDHVRNPHKWTCYTLDEPIYVGQGVTTQSAPDEDWKALASAEAATRQREIMTETSPSSTSVEDRFDPSSQTGIKFRRKESSAQQGDDMDGSRNNKVENSRLLQSLHDVDAGEDEGGVEHDVTEQGSAFTFNSSRGRKRHLRTKMGLETDPDAEAG